MSATLPLPKLVGYELTGDLADAAPVSHVHQPAPNESAREDLLLRKLGARGWGRMHHFWNYYEPGWGEGHGRPLSPRATEAFFRFLEHVSFPEGSKPSLFLTDEGGIELRWEDAAGQDLQVEFTATDVEIYLGSTQEESSVPLGEAVSLAQRLSPR